MTPKKRPPPAPSGESPVAKKGKTGDPEKHHSEALDALGKIAIIPGVTRMKKSRLQIKQEAREKVTADLLEGYKGVTPEDHIAVDTQIALLDSLEDCLVQILAGLKERHIAHLDMEEMEMDARDARNEIVMLIEEHERTEEEERAAWKETESELRVEIADCQDEIKSKQLECYRMERLSNALIDDRDALAQEVKELKEKLARRESKTEDN